MFICVVSELVMFYLSEQYGKKAIQTIFGEMDDKSLIYRNKYLKDVRIEK